VNDVINGQFTSWSKDEKLEGVSFGVHLLYLQIFYESSGMQEIP
jgi:hypothetical protein